MIIKSIELNNFRNYENVLINFDEGVNILYGDNAQGKTNVLESIYMFGTTKSHRRSKDREIIRFDCDEAHVRSIFEKNDVDYQIDMQLSRTAAGAGEKSGKAVRRKRYGQRRDDQRDRLADDPRGTVCADRQRNRQLNFMCQKNLLYPIR